MWENIYQTNKEKFQLFDNAETYDDLEKVKEDNQYIEYNHVCMCIDDMTVDLPFEFDGRYPFIKILHHILIFYFF